MITSIKTTWEITIPFPLNTLSTDIISCAPGSNTEPDTSHIHPHRGDTRPILIIAEKETIENGKISNPKRRNTGKD